MPEPAEISTDTRRDLVALVLGHVVGNAALLTQACTHASTCPSQTTEAQRLDAANERLEFLGDALLGAALCDLLYRLHPLASEGALSRRKALLASRATLARLFDLSGLADCCRVSPLLPQPWPESVRANLIEGILGAIAIDGGFPAVVQAVDQLFGELLREAAVSGPDDAKTRLQEWCLGQQLGLPSYTNERCGGLDHAPEFKATARIGERSATGTGSSRRRAESVAAAALLEQLREPPVNA